VRAVFPVSTLALLVVTMVVLLRVREPVEVVDEDTSAPILMRAK